MEYNTLWHGKYRNYTFLQVETSDKPYCAWVLRSESLPLSLRLFQHYLKQRHGGISTIGKHAYNWYDLVASTDPSYTVWAASLTDPSGDLSKFQSYLVELAARRPPPAMRRSRLRDAEAALLWRPQRDLLRRARSATPTQSQPSS